MKRSKLELLFHLEQLRNNETMSQKEEWACPDSNWGSSARQADVMPLDHRPLIAVILLCFLNILLKCLKKE